MASASCERQEELLHLFEVDGLALPIGLCRDALLKTASDDLETGPVECPRDRGQLGDDVGTVTSVLPRGAAV